MYDWREFVKKDIFFEFRESTQWYFWQIIGKSRFLEVWKISWTKRETNWFLGRQKNQAKLVQKKIKQISLKTTWKAKGLLFWRRGQQVLKGLWVKAQRTQIKWF